MIDRAVLATQMIAKFAKFPQLSGDRVHCASRNEGWTLCGLIRESMAAIQVEVSVTKEYGKYFVVFERHLPTIEG